MRTCFIVLWAFGFGMLGGALSGIVSALLERAHVQMQQGTLYGIPYGYIGWAFILTGAFLGIYEKLPGTKRKKSGL